MQLSVVSHEEKQMHFNYVWLRDHCCDSYILATHQRSLDTGAIDLTIRPQRASVEDDSLVITCKSKRCHLLCTWETQFPYLNQIQFSIKKYSLLGL